MSAEVKKGGTTTAARQGATPKPKALREVIAAEDAGEKPTAYISRNGHDAAWLIPPGPRWEGGRNVGWDPGLHVNFRGVGVTEPRFPESNPIDRQYCERVDQFIKTNDPIIHELGLSRLEPEAPRPPFAKWDALSAPAVKVTLSSLLGDDHDDNVKYVKECARYEIANQNRDEVLAVLDGLMATEAAVSDAFDVAVSLV